MASSSMVKVPRRSSIRKLCNQLTAPSLRAGRMVAIASNFGFLGASILACLTAIFFSGRRNTNAWHVRTLFGRLIRHCKSFLSSRRSAYRYPNVAPVLRQALSMSWLAMAKRTTVPSVDGPITLSVFRRANIRWLRYHLAKRHCLASSRIDDRVYE